MPQLAFAGGQPVADVAQAVNRAPTDKNSIATNWPQQVKPLALRSASCLRTAESKSARGINLRTWEKILHTMDKAASSSDGQVLDKPNLSDRRSLTPAHQLLTKILSWTRVVSNEEVRPRFQAVLLTLMRTGFLSHLHY